MTQKTNISDTLDLSPDAIETLADRLEAIDHASVADCFLQSPLYAHAAATLRALSAEVIRLRAECFMLAAGACGGHYGDDYGHSRCSLVDAQRTRAEAAEAEIARLRAMLDAVMDVEKVQPTGDPSDPLSWNVVSSYVVAGSVHEAALTRADEAETRAEALAAEVIRLRQENETLRQRVAVFWEANNAARAALEDDA